MAFLKHSDISDGLFLKIYLENLGIPLDRAKELYAEYSGGSAVLLAKAEKGSKTITAEVKGGAELVLLDAGTYTGNVPPTGDSENIALYFVLIAAAAAAIAAVFALKRKASEK